VYGVIGPYQPFFAAGRAAGKGRRPLEWWDANAWALKEPHVAPFHGRGVEIE
jgi:hypothetical protein